MATGIMLPLSRVNGTASLYIDGNLDISASLPTIINTVYALRLCSSPAQPLRVNPQLEYHGSL